MRLPGLLENGFPAKGFVDIVKKALDLPVWGLCTDAGCSFRRNQQTPKR